MIMSRQVEINIVRLHPKHLRSFILIFIKRLSRSDILQTNFLGRHFIDSLHIKGVKIIFSQNDPLLLPFLHHPRFFIKITLLYLALLHIRLSIVVFIHYPNYIFYQTINTMRPLVLKGHERPITIVRFNYDGDLFFSGSAETKINLWEAYTGERLGSYETKASVRSLDVDINSQILVACGNDGSLEFFQVKTGKSIKYIRFPFKLKQIQFDLGSNRFFLLHDQYRAHTPSALKVYDFKTIFTSTTTNEDQVLKIPYIANFQTILNDQKPNKIATRALWYIDNNSFFISTNDGWLVHYDINGKILKKALLHEATKINSIAFSKNFAVIATAADNGSKIVDPQTLEVLRYFKQQLPMNAVSISPLFCDEVKPKFHMVMGGGVAAIMAAMTGGHSGFEAHVCNIMHGNEVGKISGHYGPINSMQFFRDGRGFISGGQEGIIRVIRFSQEYFQGDNPQFE